MPPQYSREDEKAMIYVWSILGIVIAVSSYFCVQYNDEQVSKRLKVEGITIYCRVTDVYENHTGKYPIGHVILNYTRSKEHPQVDLEVAATEFSAYRIADTVILRRLPDINYTGYMKVIGFRSNGSDLLRGN